MKRLRLVPTSSGSPPSAAFSSAEPMEDLEVVLRGLAEADARVDEDPLARARRPPPRPPRRLPARRPPPSPRRRRIRRPPCCASGRGARRPRAAASAVSGSRRAAHTSLTIVAPAASAARATAPFWVSMLTSAPAPNARDQRRDDRQGGGALLLRPRPAAARRRTGAAGSTRRRRRGAVDAGRDEAPPPGGRRRRRPRRRDAPSGAMPSPLKESGVTLMIPITHVRSPKRSSIVSRASRSPVSTARSAPTR